MFWIIGIKVAYKTKQFLKIELGNSNHKTESFEKSGIDEKNCDQNKRGIRTS